MSEKELSCETPSYETFGPRASDVYVSINKSDYTITKAQFKYFLNTKAEQTIAYGPGLLNENAIGQDTMFVI